MGPAGSSGATIVLTLAARGLKIASRSGKAAGAVESRERARRRKVAESLADITLYPSKRSQYLHRTVVFMLKTRDRNI